MSLRFTRGLGLIVDRNSSLRQPRVWADAQERDRRNLRRLCGQSRRFAAAGAGARIAPASLGNVLCFAVWIRQQCGEYQRTV